MCHNDTLGVTVKTVLKPDEVVFTNMNRQIEHHIGVSYRTQTHIPLPLSTSLVAALPLSVTSCGYLWVCASAVNVRTACPISSPCFRYDREERGGWAMRKSPAIDPGLRKKVSVLLITEGRKRGT